MKCPAFGKGFYRAWGKASFACEDGLKSDPCGWEAKGRCKVEDDGAGVRRKNEKAKRRKGCKRMKKASREDGYEGWSGEKEC